MPPSEHLAERTVGAVAGVDAEAMARAAGYLASRQCANGGFCFYRSDYFEEPNLHDTWHAVATLRLLGEAPRQRGNLTRFVAAQPVSAQPYGLYYRVRTLPLLGSDDPQRTAVGVLVATLSAHPPEPDASGLCRGRPGVYPRLPNRRRRVRPRPKRVAGHRPHPSRPCGPDHTGRLVAPSTDGGLP